MTTTQIITKLREAGIVTVGDLDAWAHVRRLNRWQALGVLVGVEAADSVFGALAVTLARKDYQTLKGEHYVTTETN